MDDVGADSGQVDSQGGVHRQRVARHEEQAAGVQDQPHRQQDAQGAEQGQRQSGAGQPSRSEAHPCQQPRHAEGQHLPGRPRPLAEEEVADQHTGCAAQTACLAAKGDAGEDNDSRRRLEKGHGSKGHASYDCHSTEDSQQHQLLGGGLFSLIREEERCQG